MQPEIYTTSKIYSTANSVLIYFSNFWGFQKDDLVRISLYRMDDKKKTTYSMVRRVCNIGNGKGCYLDRMCDLQKGDVIIAKIVKVGTSKEDSGEFDTGISIEKRFEDPFD